MKKGILAAIMCIAAMVAGTGVFAGCQKSDKEQFVVGGSSSVSPLMSVLADAYMETHDDVSITVVTTDSGTGIANARSGSYAIGMASKNVEGYDDLATATLCKDGIACIVNKSCAMTGVTRDQLKQLYTTETAIDKITYVISRESGSGTFGAFTELIGFEESEMRKTGIAIYNSTPAVISAIESNAAGNTLGYISMGSLPKTGNVKALSFDGVEATTANVADGSYGLSRPFVVMYNNTHELGEAEKAFFDWLLTEDAKAIIAEQGYVNL